MSDPIRSLKSRSAAPRLIARFAVPSPAAALAAAVLLCEIATNFLAAPAARAATLSTITELQPGGARAIRGEPGGAGGPEISKRSVDRYANLLGLDPIQREAAAALQQGYFESIQKISQEMQDSLKTIQDEAQNGDHSALFEKMPEIMCKHGEKRAALQRSFMDDLKSLLTPKQEEAWPKLERLRRREGLGGGMGTSMVSGSSIDLTELVPKLKLPDAETAKLDDILEQYQQDLDKAIVEREKARAERDGGDSGKITMDFDMEKIKARAAEEREAAVKVRDLNRQYERRIGALLSDESRAKLDEEFKKRSFRQIFKEPMPSKMLGAALKFDDLDASQITTLLAEKETYQREVASLNEKWMRALDKAETEGKAGGMFMLPGMSNESEELAAARKARRDLDEKTSQRIKSALNEKQREKMPKKSNSTNNVQVTNGGAGVATSTFIAADGGDGEEDSEGPTGGAIIILNTQEHQ